MNKNDYIHTLHNIDQTRDIINAAVNAFCDNVTDSCLIIDLGFERLIHLDSDYDTTPNVVINIFKADDYRAPKKPSFKWTNKDQNLISALEGPTDLNEDPSASIIPVQEPQPSYWDSFLSYWYKTPTDEASSKKLTSESDESEDEDKKKRISGGQEQMVRHKAINWELPSAEFYAIKYLDINKRKLNLRRSQTDVQTAQEAPAVREKQSESNDVTDRDCTSIRTTSNSVESLVQEEQAKEPVMSLRRRTKRRSSTSKINDLTSVNSQSFQKSVRSLNKSTMTSPKPSEIIVEKFQKISIRRRPDCGELTVLNDKNGVVTFTALVKPMERRQH